MDILNKHKDGCPSDSTYIGRGSAFGNILVIGKDGTREEVIAWYRHWLMNKLIARDPVVEKAFKELTKDSKLLCFCSPKPCHGEVIREYWEFFCKYSDYETALVAFRKEYQLIDSVLYTKYRKWLLEKLLAKDSAILEHFRNGKVVNEILLPFRYSVSPLCMYALNELRLQLLDDGNFDKALVEVARKDCLLPIYEPITDGENHINVYSKAKTKLGRALSNFSPIGFDHPKYGTFASMEGYWYWLATGKKHDTLKLLSGYEAKELGRKFPRVDCEDFQADIKKGLLLRTEQNPALSEAMRKCTLPFAHYYSYGSEICPKIIVDDKNTWVVEYLELIRKYLRKEAHKLIIAGSRKLTDLEFVTKAFKDSELIPIEIVSGKAKGADTLGEEIAKSLKLPIAEFHADWDNLGNRAGMIRNEQMGDYATALVACPMGESIGTYGMIRYMHKLGKRYHVVKYEK